MTATTYTVIARDSTATNHPITWECGHQHRSLPAAAACLAGESNADGSWSARSHHALIEGTDGSLWTRDGLEQLR